MENQTQNHIHKFEDTVVEATCSAPGYTLHRCQCGYEYKDRFTPAKEHRFKVSEKKDPTCTKEGKQEIYCRVCGTTGTQVLPPLGHAWDDWTVKTAPTCLEKGIKTRTCVRCGETEEDKIAPLGHKLTNPRKSETKKGYKEYFCENCGQTVMKKTFGKKLTGWIIGLLIAAIILVGGYFAVTMFLLPHLAYNDAIALMEDGKYEDAIEAFEALDGYKDSDDKIKECEGAKVETDYAAALALLEDRNDTEAYYALKALGDYKDSADLLDDFIVVYEKELCYDSDGNKSGETKCEYDEMGNLTSEVSYDENGNKEWETKHKYDAMGNLTSAVTYDGDGNKIWEGKYDKNGNQIWKVAYDANGNIISEYKYKYEYDEKGNITNAVTYNGEGNIIQEYKYQYEYDEKGNKIKEVRYDADGNKKWEDTYELENLTSSVYYDADGNKELEYTYKYDEDGFMIKSTVIDYYFEYSITTEYDDYKIFYRPDLDKLVQKNF